MMCARIREVGRSLLVVSLWLSWAAFAHAGDWPQFRGPNGAGVSDETGLPVRWGPGENIRWRADLPGRGLSCPVIAKGRVFVTACSGYQQSRLHVLCLDEATGKQLWERQFWATGNTLCHDKTCMAAPTPVTDGDRVYALFATGDVAGLDAAGNLLWYRSLAHDHPTIGNNVGMAASPVLYKDVLILPMENVGESFAAGLDKYTGRDRWKVERSRDINWVTPLVIEHHGRAEVLFQSGGNLAAYDPLSGRALWAYRSGGLGTVSSPVAKGDLVLTAGGPFRAVRPPAEVGGKPEVIWQSPRLKPGYTSPLYYDGRVYTINSPNLLLCADAATGKVVWDQRLKEGAYWASPFAADGKLYLLNEEGTTTVVQTGDKPAVLARNALGETMLATPAAANGALFLRSDRHLFCIGSKR